MKPYAVRTKDLCYEAVVVAASEAEAIRLAIAHLDSRQPEASPFPANFRRPDLLEWEAAELPATGVVYFREAGK
jgi:hypothetical protein